MNYFDIHCHILPGVDDGARDMDTSLAMINKAYNEGIRAMILTPHYHGGHVETNRKIIDSQFRKLKGLAKESCPKMNLILGNEIYYYQSVPDWIEEGRVHTLADSNYVLLEFANGVEKRELFDAVSNMCSYGYYPILAHVERYACLVKDANIVGELIDMGAYIQINSRALCGKEGVWTRKFLKKLLKNEWVHFVGTDAHSMGTRQPEMAECAEYIIQKCEEEYAAKVLYLNALTLVRNKPLS